MRSPLPLIALLCACKTTPEVVPIEVAQGPGLARFQSCAQLKDHVADSWVEELVLSRYGGAWGWAVSEDAEAGGDDGGGGEEGPTDYSETTTQEEGVDEPDLVKTNGTHLFVAHGQVLDVVKSWPAEDTAHVGRLELEGNPFALFLDGDTAIVLSSVWQYDYAGDGGSEVPEDGGGYYDGNGTVPVWNDGVELSYRYSTRVSTVDVSDPTAPSLTHTIDLEGWYVDARRIDHDIYVVANTWAYPPSALWQLAYSDELGLPEVNYEADDTTMEIAREIARGLLRPEVEALVDAMSLAQLLPERSIDGAPPDLLTECTDVYRPQDTSSPAMLSVTHINPATAEVSATGLMADGWEVYASQDHLYVAQTSWWWWGWWFEDEPTLETHIHRFDLDGADTTYTASGSVPGWLLNRYSMSEYEGYLRVATTDVSWWWSDEEEEPANRVAVLEDQGGTLEIVGEVDGIAPGEQITTARFLGQVGWLVTFEQVDPLFSLDLSDPTDPRVVGELKVTGFSSYLHPAGEDHLISVGMEGDDDGAILGFAISLFDISDLANPVLADRKMVESDDWSWSESLWDPHAFTYHRDTVAVPLYTYDYDDSTGAWTDFSGLWVLGVDLDSGSLLELGFTSQDEIAAATECPTDDWVDDCYEDSLAWLRRSVVIEDWLYSVSNLGVAVTPLGAPGEPVATVVFYPAD